MFRNSGTTIDIDDQDASHVTYQLPSSIYTASIVTHFVFEKSVALVIFIWLLVALTYGFKLYFIVNIALTLEIPSLSSIRVFNIWQVTLIAGKFFFLHFVHLRLIEKQLLISQPSYSLEKILLQFLGVLVFVIVCFQEFMETVNMCQFLKHATDPNTNSSVDDIFTDLQVSSTHQGMRESSTCYKVVAYGLIIIPRFAIAITLMFFGTGFILQKLQPDPVEILFDATGLLFLNEIDEIFWLLLPQQMTQDITRCLSSLKVPISEGTCCHYSSRIALFLYLKSLGIFALATVLTLYWAKILL